MSKLRSPLHTATQEKSQRKLTIRMVSHGVLLGLLFSLAFTFSSSYAQGIKPPCGANEASCRVSGGFSAVSVENTNPNLTGIASPSSPAFGALVYTDFKQIEAVAREHLGRAITMRESISPYKANNNFDQHLRQLDYQSGFTKVWGGTSPYPSGLTFLEIVNKVESDLTTARNYYAFLAVFAPEQRFRTDSFYTASLCGTTDKEDPVPPDPLNTGQVKPPIVDWCNFKARLRQSVREAANVRMIIGQEFMVDALGMNFSGNFVGGENFVREEVARLRAAQNQFKLAEQFLAAGLTYMVGNGCWISDFYMEAEWSLLSRSSEQQGTIQYLVGSRLSYLGVSTESGAAQAKTNSGQTMRKGANDGYIKLLGVAGQARIGKAEGCALGEHPDGSAVADMALNMLETQRQAREIASGRNIFGFDVTFTPARAYKSSGALNCATNAEGTRGLWDEAYCSAERAQDMQERAENKQRLFDQSQTELLKTVDAMIQGLDKHIDDVVGCNRTEIGNDAGFFTCAKEQIAFATECLGKVTDGDKFDACMQRLKVNKANDINTALRDLRSIYLEYQSIKTSADNIQKRIVLSEDANKGIVNGMYRRLEAETVATLAQIAFDGVGCFDFSSKLDSGITCGIAAGLNAVAQGSAGAASNYAEISIVGAENKQEIENLSLDLTELAIAAQAANQAYLSKWSNVKGMLTALARDVNEDERQRAYLLISPANDPSFRIVRDSARLELAEALERAAQMAYLAARRAEYEYAARLAASDGFAISDIYRARTAQDILNFLDKLQNVTGNLAGEATQERAALALPRYSVAKHFLLLTDAALSSPTIDTSAEIEAERIRRFREWVGKSTKTIGGEQRLVFTVTTSLQDSGVIKTLLPSGSDQQWRLMLGGVGSPEAGNTGVSVNLVTTQQGVSYRKVEVSHGGMVHLRSFAGCIFNYRLVAPTTMLGYEWAKNQDPEVALDFFNANVNDSNPYTDIGFRSKRFEGRPLSSTAWRIEVRTGVPESGSGLPVMDLQQLTDIELLLSATYSPRDEGTPSDADCARVDY